MRRALRMALALAAVLAAIPAAAQEKVAVGVLRFVSSGALFVAVERGTFKQEGLDVDLKLFDATSHALAAEIARHVYPSEPAEKAAGLVEASTFYVDPQARLNVGDIYARIAWYKSQGMVDASVDPKALIDLSFVQGDTNLPR
jgi:ABC-type nitrate/sulfonate/bicarbonate transport system substrate-binding protein